MKYLFLSMTALTAFGLAAPASAQQGYARSGGSAELSTQIDAGIRSGAISGRELTALRESLRRLTALERQFAPNGISGTENAVLQQRSADLRRQIRMADRGTQGRMGREDRATWDASYDRDHRAEWEARYAADRETAWNARAGSSDRWGRSQARYDSRFDHRFDGPPLRDRFSGDVRIGQRGTSRMMALPAEYRDDFQDNEDVYYRMDEKRVYRIDRRTQLVQAMLELGD